jgi:hypothetical protein
MSEGFVGFLLGLTDVDVLLRWVGVYAGGSSEGGPGGGW